MKKAVCLLVKAGSRYLAVTRRDSEMIGLPGGKVDPGENELQAIVREVQEEVGLKLNPVLLKPVFTCVCAGEVDYETTGFTYPDLSIEEISSIIPEDGLRIKFVSKEDLCHEDTSPFANYNQQLFEITENLNDPIFEHYDSV